MQFKPKFALQPLPPIPGHPTLVQTNPLGPLAQLPGTWIGTGFNTIWRPFNINTTPPLPVPQDHFLELNLTNDQIEFTAIPGQIPNRGLLQPDINLAGMTYLQQISDANVGAGLHIEPGIWAAVPPTSDPLEGQTVIRMASIPHGTAILAQGTATTTAGPPAIPANSITPFDQGRPSELTPFPESTLTTSTTFRSPANQIAGISQRMVDNPNSVLIDAIAQQTILETTTITVSSSPAAPLTGGGTANSTFLQGGNDGPNAQSALVTATFWIETLADGDPLRGIPPTLQLQYTQTVVLDFIGIGWPHVTVGTLRKQPPPAVTPVPRQRG